MDCHPRIHGAATCRTGIRIAEERAAADPSIFLPRQFENPYNALDHEEHTAPEILRQTGGRVDAFVAGFGLRVGTSSGANVAAALVIARELAPDAVVVTILCDRAERYYSTQLFNHL